MGENSGHRIPVCARAWLSVGFEVVGVELDETWQKEVTVYVVSGNAFSGGDVSDLAVSKKDRAMDDVVVEDDSGVGEHSLATHWSPS
jgi:argonaute-like protein implicated in RNA metabolism and viral defense